MRLTFLGTGAGEGYPGRWCDCHHCRYARQHGGKNIRMNSCAMIDDDLLLDLNGECFATAAWKSIDLLQARYLLVTHAHEDHFVPQHLVWRRMPEGADRLTPDAMRPIAAPRFTPLPHLTVIGNHYVEAALRARIPADQEADGYAMSFQTAQAGVPLEYPGLRIMPVQSRHGSSDDFALNYIIERGGKTILYALDTGGYTDAMIDILRRFRYDLIVMEGTRGDVDADPGGHMNMKKNLAMAKFFRSEHLLVPGGRFILSHLSPHWTPPHDKYEPMMREHQIDVAYDGLQITVN
ncbi:MAG: MBL fold metallo-hydrolase [Eubacteriales bacterium]|nr:MBL fold metallo-hydrolase [Eubacteriales bacterium]